MPNQPWGHLPNPPVVIKHSCSYCGARQATYEGGIPRRWLVENGLKVCERCKPKYKQEKNRKK